MYIYTTLPPDINLFAPGLAGTLRWMGYRLKSRSENATREAQLRWRSEVLPTLAGYASPLTAHAGALLERIRSTEGLTGFAPASEATQNQGRTDVHA